MTLNLNEMIVSVDKVDKNNTLKEKNNHFQKNEIESEVESFDEDDEEDMENMMVQKEKKRKAQTEDVPEMDKYLRKIDDDGENKNIIKKAKNKKLSMHLKKSEAKFRDAAISAAKAEILHEGSAGYLEAEGMEKTYKFTQKLLAKQVDINTARKIFDLNLDTFGPYSIDYARNGSHLLLGGRKGHISMIDTLRMDSVTEFHVQETVRDIAFLHNFTMFAVAQKKYTYIYDNSGAEIHCLREQLEPSKLEFLPFHFLLVGVGRSGSLRYQDTSTGQLVVEHRTKLGPCESMTQNSYNAIINLGHANGTVTMWSPNMNTPLVKMLCHRGPVRDLAVDKGGQYMVTTGLDGYLKVWDVRTFKELHSYKTATAASCVDISQRGLLSVGFGPNIQIWKDALATKAKLPYMTHTIYGHRVNDVQFRPYDDVLSIGHSNGISSIVIPGSGEPNFDSFEANPYSNRKQRREAEVVSLLEKIRPEMITLNPNVIGTVDKEFSLIQAERSAMVHQINKPNQVNPEKKKMRGRNKLSKRMKKKQGNVIDEQKVKYREAIENKEKKSKEEKMKLANKEKAENAPKALQRFFQ